MNIFWDSPVRDISKFMLRSFFYESTSSQKNQSEISKMVVSVLPVLTVWNPLLAVSCFLRFC